MIHKFKRLIIYSIIFAIWHILFAYILMKLFSKNGSNVSILVVLNVLASAVLWLSAFMISYSSCKRGDSALLKDWLLPSVIVWLLVVSLLGVIHILLQDIRRNDIVNPLLRSVQTSSCVVCFYTNKVLIKAEKNKKDN